MKEKKNNITDIYQSIIDIFEEAKLRIERIKNDRENSFKVKEDVIKDAIEGDTEVNANNYFKYMTSIQLQEMDLLKVISDLSSRYEVFIQLETAMDFPVELIDMVDRYNSEKEPLRFKLSLDGKKIEDNDKELEKFKEMAIKLFENGFNNEWLEALKK